MSTIDHPDVRADRPAVLPDRGRGGADKHASQRQTFVRRCLLIGITMAVLGAAGLARGALMSLGGLVLVIGLFAHLIGVEERYQSSFDPPDEDPLDDPLGELAPIATDEDPVDHPLGEPAPIPTDEDPLGEMPTTPVRFRLPTAVGAATVHLVGEFNDWSHERNPMARNGEWFQTELRLEVGRSYRYRYLLDGHRWENAWDADAYAPNSFGTEDSVLDLTWSSDQPTAV